MKTIEELFSDKKFVIKILSLQTNEEIQKEFEKNDVKISLEEIQKIKDKFQEFIDNPNKIPDEAMQNISGGVSVGSVLKGTANAIITTGAVVTAWYSMYRIYNEFFKPKSNINVIHPRY